MRKINNRFSHVLERDGFLHGINYPWLSWGLGHVLAGNDLFAEHVDEKYRIVTLDEYGEQQVFEDLINLKTLGYNAVCFWGSLYGEGIVWDAYGDVLGVKEEYLVNLRRYMDIVRATNTDLLYVVHAHSETAGEYFGKEIWDIISQMYSNRHILEHYIERFVRPVMRVLADYTDNLLLISAGSEAENEINDSELGNNASGGRAFYGVTKESMRFFLRRITETAAEMLPDVARTLVTNSDMLNMYNDFDLDAVGVNLYRSSARMEPIETYRTVHPMLVTEWGLGAAAPTEEEFCQRNMDFMQNIEDEGCLGSFWWAYLPFHDQGGNPFSLLRENCEHKTDFRSLAYRMHYHILEYRNRYHGITGAMDPPALFYSAVAGHISWIACRQAVAMDIERRTDGEGEWKKLEERVAPSVYETEYRGYYTDPALPKQGTVCYRIVAYDANGNTVRSLPSNAVKITG